VLLTWLRQASAWATLVLALASQAQETPWHLHTTLQTGVDAWRIAHSASDSVTRSNMYLADSEPRWSYRELSPWFTLQSRLDMGPQDQVVLRTRANQSTGGSLDQLYYDHAISPYLGLRVGVADYRATWCREYDLDNPWVRESDPFCTNHRIRLPTSSAPALQAYVNLDAGEYQLQGIAGIYRPRALGYAPREFGTAILPEQVVITQNHKQGISLNLLNKASSTEWRLSWTGLDQGLYDPDASAGFRQYSAGTRLNYRQHADTYFVGVSWQVSPRLRARLTHMRTALKARCELLTQQSAPACLEFVSKQATVLELNQQHDAENILSFTLLKFPFEQAGYYAKVNQTVSGAWRRDWGGGWFTAVQLSQARSRVFYIEDIALVQYLPGTASAWAAGFRLGRQW